MSKENPPKIAKNPSPEELVKMIVEVVPAKRLAKALSEAVFPDGKKVFNRFRKDAREFKARGYRSRYDERIREIEPEGGWGKH